MTVDWAINTGFNEEEAKIIANGCRSIDIDNVTEPLTGDQSWHFDKSKVDENPSNKDTRLVHSEDCFKNAIDLMKDPKTYREGLYELGRGLHPLQDIDAHQKQGIDNPGWIGSPHDEGLFGWFKLIAGAAHWDDINYDNSSGKWNHTGSENNKRLVNTHNKSTNYLGKAVNYKIADGVRYNDPSYYVYVDPDGLGAGAS